MKKHVDDKNNYPGPKVSYQSFSAVTSPEIIEKGQGKWVDYGSDNQYPQLLIEKYHKSAVHNSLVTGISLFIAGEEITGLKDPSKVNSLGDTFHETFAKCGFDLKLHGYYCLQVVYSLDGKNILERLHVPAEKVRSGMADPSGKIHNYYIHPNWVNVTGKTQPKKIAAFDPKDGMKDKRQLQFVKLPSAPGQFYYRTPDYVGAMNYISLDDSISEFHLDNIETGFFPSAIIQFFNGEPTEDEQRSIESAFKNKFAGARGKKLVFVYNKNKNQSVQFDTFEPADLDERFKNLAPQVTEKIMIAHRVTTPMLFGVKTETGFGNNADEMKVGLLIMNKLVIVPYQKTELRGFKKTFIGDEADLVIEVQTLQPEEFLDIGNSGEVSSDTEEDIDEGSTEVAIIPDTPGTKVTSGEPVGISTTISDEAASKQLEAQAGLRGSVGGVQGILQIQTAVADGLTSFDSAVAMLVEIYGFTEEVAIKLLGTKTEENAQNVEDKQTFSTFAEQRLVIPKDVKVDDKKVLKQLDKVGQKKDVLEKDFFLIQIPDSIKDEDVELYLKAKYNFAIQSDPDEKSTLDKGLFKIRYEYHGPQDAKNRSFCSQVLSKDLIYRKEDINQMSFTTSNPEFGTYSIYKYKGSFGCRHRWKRLIYFRKRSSGGQFLPNEGLDNDQLLASSTEAQVPEGAREKDATTVNPKPSR